MTQEEKSLFVEAAAEIRSLRRVNEVLQAKVSTFENVMMVLHTVPSYASVGMSEDVAWKIDKIINQQ